MWAHIVTDLQIKVDVSSSVTDVNSHRMLYLLLEDDTFDPLKMLSFNNLIYYLYLIFIDY